MADATAQMQAQPKPPGRKARAWTRLMASPRFQAWAARFPLTKSKVAREGAEMFDIVAGFCHAQILQAFVKFDLPAQLLERELPVATLANMSHVPPARMHILIQGAVSLNLVKVRRNGCVALTTRGAALAGVPGLQGMIAHHDVLYRDLSDPVAFFRGEVETELADFWPYVFGAGGATDPQVTQTYSDLMADSQSIVAADTLAAVSLRGVRHLMDIGGGTGAFLAEAARAYPALDMTLLDLPAVAPAAKDRFAQIGALDRLTIVPGSFRDDMLPKGADMISLVRVLYDHADDTVLSLLRSTFEALPPGGRIMVSEPMTGGRHPQRAGDAYFALYCLAMRTGKARSADEIVGLLTDAGFQKPRKHKVSRPFVTSVVTAVRPD